MIYGGDYLGLSRKRKMLIIVFLDICLLCTANIGTYIFLHPYVTITTYFFLSSLFLSLFIYLVMGSVLHVFSTVNRYTSLHEMVDILYCTLSVALINLIVFEWYDYPFSRRYVILTFLLNTSLIIASRLVWRIIIESRNKKKFGNIGSTLKNTLIIGAGEGGRILIDNLKHSRTGTDIQVVGIVDDAPDRYHTYVNGVKVLGTTYDLPEIISKYNIEMVTVAIPSIDPANLERIVQIIKPFRIPVNTIPALEEVAKGTLTVSKMKEIDIVDLLGREEVKLDLERIDEHITDKVILVTGAGGSIGSEICRQILHFSPKKLLLLGHGENSIYLIERELRSNYLENQSTEIVPIIAEIQDREMIFNLMEQYRPDIVYHAAAHKHVPLMEENPIEAVKNNVYGTLNVAEAAKASHVGDFVMISTDKAVRPPNVMGATKRIAEMIITGLNEQGQTKFSAVRFGNVLGSRGSVIPVFREQIAKGGPITVTDFRMTRYFMTIPEASKLVIQAGALARGGEIFILDMGQPVKIFDLAQKMVQLSGYNENQIEIKESGIRPGEKLYEELLVDTEKNEKQVFEKIFIGNVHGFSLESIREFLNSLPDDPTEVSKKVVEFANRSSK